MLLQRLAKARLMSEHRPPAEHLDLEVTVDSPFITLQVRGWGAITDVCRTGKV